MGGDEVSDGAAPPTPDVAKFTLATAAALVHLFGPAILETAAV
jgi:hypothetical protein